MTKDMTKGSIAKGLILFSIPLILSGLLQQLYSWADAFIVGNIEGENALAAIGATNVVTNLLIMGLVGFTSGISIMSARNFGCKNFDIQRNIVFTFLIVLGGTFLLLSIIGIFTASSFLVLLKTPVEILDMARKYLQIVMIGIPFLCIYNVYSAVLRGIGDSKAPFYSVLVSSVMNILLDIVFVAMFGWGVEGAAIATVISQIIMSVFIIGYAVRRYEILRFCIRKEKLNPSVLLEGCRLSLPICIQSLISAGGNLILQGFMNGFGTTTVAAITTAYRIDTMILLPVINMGTGISTITAQNLGAGEQKRMHKTLWVGTGLITGIAMILTLIIVRYGGNLVELFGVSAASVVIGANFFRVFGSYYPVFGILNAFRGFLEGTGRVTFTSFFSILSLMVRIGLSYALKPVFGNMTIAYAEAFSWYFLLVPYGGMILYLMLKQRKDETRECMM